MHRFISGIWILFHWSVCVFLCHPIKTYSFDHYPFEIRYCGVSSFFLLTRDDFCYLKCFMVPKTLCCCCSVTKSCPALCNPWTAARQAFLSFTISREFTQTHVHWVSDAIQPSHVLPPPSLALNLSSIRVFFQWASSSHQVGKVLEFQHHFLPMNIQGWFPWCSRDYQESSPTPQLITITIL